MKYTFVALALAALAQAQTRADIPACALPCLDAAVTKDTKCSTSDFTCICKNFDAVQADATGCVIEKCGTDVAISKVLPATQALCKAAAGGGSGSGSSSSAAQSSPAQQSSSSAAQTSAEHTSAAQTTPAQQTSSSAPSSAPPSSAPAQTTTAAQTTPAGPVGSGTGVVPPPAGNKTTTGAPTAPTNGGSAILPGLALVAALCAFAL